MARTMIKVESMSVSLYIFLIEEIVTNIVTLIDFLLHYTALEHSVVILHVYTLTLTLFTRPYQ